MALEDEESLLQYHPISWIEKARIKLVVQVEEIFIWEFGNKMKGSVVLDCANFATQGLLLIVL